MYDVFLLPAPPLASIIRTHVEIFKIGFFDARSAAVDRLTPYETTITMRLSAVP